MNKYLEEFLGLNCAGDVLNVVSPVARFEKEITEAMAIVKQVKKIVFADRSKNYTVVDLCAGNALASVIIAHLLPVQGVLAVDRKKRDRLWEAVRGFVYENADISDDWLSIILATPPYQYIIISSHPCQMAHPIVDIFNKHDYIRHLVLMPCCHGKRRNKIPQGVVSKLGKYLTWAYDISLSAKGDFIIDKNCISPCNAVVIASKKDVYDKNKI